jgi:threonine 3-dehydrogenase
MIQCGLDITPVITHRYDYTAFEEAFQVMRSGQSGKVVLTWADKVGCRHVPNHAETPADLGR